MSRSHSRLHSIRAIRDRWPVLLLIITAMVFAAPLSFAAPPAGKGKPDKPTQDKVTGYKSTVSGTVTNNYGVPVAGAEVTFDAFSYSFSTTTDGQGQYTIKVAPATYDVTITAMYHATYKATGSILKSKNNTLDAVLTAAARVIVTPDVANGPPGAELSATGSYVILDGSTFVSSNWSQTTDEGVPAIIGDPSSLDTTVTLGSASDYAAHLIQLLKEPPITAADLPPDLNLQPINEIEKGLQNRNQVVGIDPMALERAEEVPLTLSVTTTSGTYSGSANVVTQLPWVVNTGLPTVPVNVPVLLYAKDDASYELADNGQPDRFYGGADGCDTQTPWFTPDAVGTYEITEIMVPERILMVHVGRYHGVIDPVLTLDSVQFGDGRPVGDPNCTGCHQGRRRGAGQL